MPVEALTLLESVRSNLGRDKMLGTQVDGNFTFLDLCEQSDDSKYRTAVELGLLDQLKQVGLMISRVNGIESVDLGIQMENSVGDFIRDDSEEDKKCVLRLTWLKNDDKDSQDVMSIEVSIGDDDVSIKSDAFLPNDDVQSIELPLQDLDVNKLNEELIRAFSRPIGMGAIIQDCVPS